ncbi:hypothetical protein HPO94_03230 [Citrobacter portucalensis]|uniref:hypothetical protein n=1 Tax=Citrobacter portucalensis TaxID=1639133 RepID=UPI002FEF6AB4
MKRIMFLFFFLSSSSFAGQPMSFICGNDYVQIYSDNDMKLTGGVVNNDVASNVAMNRLVKNGLAHTEIRLILPNKDFVILDYREDGIINLQKGHMVGDIGIPFDEQLIKCRRPLNG